MTQTPEVVALAAPAAEPGAANGGEPASLVSSLDMAAGPFRLNATARITTGGLLAAGAVAVGILLSVTAVVWASTSVARERERHRRG